MQGLFRLFQARFARCALQRADRKATRAVVVASGKQAEPGVTILSYDSFR